MGIMDYMAVTCMFNNNYIIITKRLRHARVDSVALACRKKRVYGMCQKSYLTERFTRLAL